MSDQLLKAKKGSPQYEEWLRKYKEKRIKKQENIQEKQLDLFDKDQGQEKKKFKTKSMEALLAEPPVFVKDKEVWKKAVTKVTYNGKKEASYAAAVRLYKLKLQKKEKELKG